MIKLQVIGYLGKDCSVNTVNGKTVINFNVAHSERYKDSAGVQKDKTTWVECAYWTDRTAIAPYLKKGQLVYAEGTPEVRTYQNKEGGTSASLSLRISNVQLLGKSDGTDSNYTPQQASYTNTNATGSQPAPANNMAEMADDLPF